MFSSNDMFANRPLWFNGPTPGNFYNFPGQNYSNTMPQNDNGSQRIYQPTTTGTSVVGLKYDGGVMIAADNLVAYGNLLRYQDMQRVYTVNEKTIIGASGDFADFQWIKRYIDQKTIEDLCFDDEIMMKPKSLYNWLTRILYNRRSRMSPLWIEMVVGGMEDGIPFLGHVDLRGRSYEDNVVATGFGKHLALPLLREHLGNTLPSKEKALELLRKCMEVLYYRDCRAMSAYSLAICTHEKSELHKDLTVNQNWLAAELVKDY